jgi:hypothetical protein
MKSIEFSRINGKGLFASGTTAIESSFTLYRNFCWIGVLTRKDLAFEGKPYRLNGFLRDGRPIRSDILHVTQEQPRERSRGCELTATEGVYLGQVRENPPPKSQYRLTGFFEGAFSFTYKGWDISSIPCPNPGTAQSMAKKWRCPVEGVTLEMNHINATSDQHYDIARTIMLLLSLACGTGVACDRHFLIWENAELEIWRHMTGGEVGPGAIIPASEIVSFLLQVLPAWESLSQTQQRDFRLAIDYINLSAHGYLDTRLFNILQPWEFLAKTWEKKGELNPPVRCLRSRLNTARKQWKNDYPESDPNGFWGTRISSIFDWPKLLDGIKQLSGSYGLDLERMGLDINLLKEARDSVAHSGRIPEQLSGSEGRASSLLSQGQYCLQLLLLRILGYRGPVCHASAGWRTILDIEKALAAKRS